MDDDVSLRLDLNNPAFQRGLLGLQKAEQLAILGTLRKLSEMTWNQVYRDTGLRWEVIHSRSGPNGARVYSIRIGRGFRALAYRDEQWMRILSLHTDHDSAYGS
ncbi:MAG: hypothetical protein ACYCVB_12730 [Bacilli bacterium]